MITATYGPLGVSSFSFSVKNVLEMVITWSHQVSAVDNTMVAV